MVHRPLAARKTGFFLFSEFTPGISYRLETQHRKGTPRIRGEVKMPGASLIHPVAPTLHQEIPASGTTSGITTVGLRTPNSSTTWA